MPAKFRGSKGNQRPAVWLASTETLTDEKRRKLAKLLSTMEREHWQALRLSSHRDAYLVAHGLKRLVLSKYEPHIQPGDWRFTENEFGKPFLVANQNASGLHFNLSHSESLAAICIAYERCGVDVEHCREGIDHLELARRLFHPREYSELERGNAMAFYRYWVLKEAFAKLLGLGLSLQLDSFYVDPQKGSVGGHPAGTTIQLASWKLSAQHFLAAAVEGRQAEWPPNVAWLPELMPRQSVGL